LPSTFQLFVVFLHLILVLTYILIFFLV
jgi:hypothetical protein